VVVRALRDSGAEGVLQVSFGQLVAAVRATVRRRRPGRGARGRGRRQPATIAGGSEDR
jgi:hypothetical protein